MIFCNVINEALCLHVYIISSLFSFDYIDPPEEKMVIEAVKQLYILGALDR